MSLGKYSPTLHGIATIADDMKDPSIRERNLNDWHTRNPEMDDYGYHEDTGLDLAGNQEEHYWNNEELYENVSEEFTIINRKYYKK